ncbi:hypothetical protein ABKN59_003308 [Abortiporus biennis]
MQQTLIAVLFSKLLLKLTENRTADFEPIISPSPGLSSSSIHEQCSFRSSSFALVLVVEVELAFLTPHFR